MLNIVLLILGLVALAYALGLAPKLATVPAYGGRVLLGVKALLVGSWALPKMENLGTWFLSYWRRLLFIGGVFLVVLALTVGGAAVSTGGNARDNLDAAIKAFQSSVNLKADGIFGPSTVKAYYGHR